MNTEIKRIIIDKGHYSENNYPFTIKPNFSTHGSFIEISQTGPTISFVTEDSIRNLFGFDETILYNDYNLSPNPVDILSFDIFLETDIAQGIIFGGKPKWNNSQFHHGRRSGIQIHRKIQRWYSMVYDEH